MPRRRAFTVFVRRDSGRFVASAQKLYDQMRNRLASKQLSITDLLCADQTVIDREVQQLVDASRKRKLDEILTPWEMQNKAAYEHALDQSDIPFSHQVMAVGQNPTHLWKATSPTCALPTLTATDKILWVRKGDRMFTAWEKFVAHGWPMRDDLASALGVPAPCQFIQPHAKHTHIYIHREREIHT